MAMVLRNLKLKFPLNVTLKHAQKVYVLEGSAFTEQELKVEIKTFSYLGIYNLGKNI